MGDSDPGSRRARRWWPWAALVLAAVAGAAFRLVALERLSPRAFAYSSESCFRFRHAELRMLGQAPPALDRAAQWPEGFDTARSVLSSPDRVAAAVHAARGGDTYLAARATIALFSALAVLAFALLALAILRSPLPAAAATLVYAGCFGAWSRSLGNYLREDFALPGLLLATAATVQLLFGGEGRRLRGASAASATAGILWAGSCWHMSQFYVALLGLLVVLAGSVRRPARAALAGGALWLGLVLAAASNEALWSKGALWNVASALTLAPALALALAHATRRAANARVFVAGAALALAGAALVAARSEGYGHVYALAWAKLAHLGRHPGPAALAPDARLFWVGPYESPDALELFTQYGFLLVPLVLGLGLVVLDAARARSAHLGFVLTSALGFAALYLLMGRMTVLFAPWAAALCVYPAWRAARVPWRVAAGGLALLALFANAYGGLSHFSVGGWYHRTVERVFAPRTEPVWTYGSEKAALLRWLQAAPPGAVLTDFAISPLVLLGTGKPIVLHPMFEVAGIRPKVLEVAHAALQDEPALLELCRRFEVRYLVHFAPQVLSREEGSYYLLTGEEPAPGSAAWRMQFEPESLQGLRLVHETASARVFEVGRSYDGYRATAPHPLFDPERFGAIPSPAELEAFYQAVHLAGRLYADGLRAEAAGDVASAATAFNSALYLHPGWEEADLRLGACLLALGRADLARPALERAAAARPDDPRPRELLGRMLDGR